MLELIDSNQAWLWLTLVVLGDFDLLAVLIYLLHSVTLVLEVLEFLVEFLLLGQGNLVGSLGEYGYGLVDVSGRGREIYEVLVIVFVGICDFFIVL